jgi:hypothetical protein
MLAMETNWVEQNSSFVGFTPALITAILKEIPAAGVVCELDECARDYFLIWKISRKET